MKRLILIFSVLIITSCSKEFKTAAPYKDITIVQAVLDAGDTAHYIGVKKAFLDDARKVHDMAQQADSNFYKSLTVMLIESEGDIITSEITTTLVDMNEEGYPKEDGIFYTEPNYAYKFKHLLDVDKSYRLLVTNNVTGKLDSSKLVDIVDPSVASDKAYEFYELNFANTDTNSFFNITGNYIKHAALVAGYMKIVYADSNIVTSQKVLKSFTILLGETVLIERHAFTIKRANELIFQDIAGNMSNPGENIVRLLAPCEVWYFAAGKELFLYREFRDQDLFIRSDMSTPIYTNMLTKDAYGVISSGVIRGNLRAVIDDKIIDSLKRHEYTAALNIVGRTSK